MKQEQQRNRRQFLQTAALAAIGASTISLPLSGYSRPFPGNDDINIIHPIEGYSPQIGIFVSMLNWIRESVIRNVEGLTQTDLNF